MKRLQIDKKNTLFISSDIKENEKQVLSDFRGHIKKCFPFDILVPVFLDPKGLIFYHGGGITPHAYIPYPEAQAQEIRGQYPKPREVDFSPLWAFVIKNEALKNLGVVPEFDKDIYKHADFCVRARRMGYKIGVCPDVKLTYKKVYTIARENKKWVGIIERSRRKFIAKHSSWLDSQYRLPVVFHTHTGFPGGYCLHSKALLKSLSQKKIRIYYKFIGGCNDDEPLADDFLVDDLRENMGSQRLPQVVLSTGLNCFSNSGDYKIGFTTTEVDGIPDNWVRVLNEMDEVWTTSEFAKKYFIKSGVKRPIYNMREGIDPNYFYPGIKPFKNNVDRKFLFIANLAWGRRKGIAEMFEAFSKEFSYKEDIALVIKALPSYLGANIKKDMATLYHRSDSAPIIVWDTVLPAYLLSGFYAAGNVFLFPSRGEGFGLPPLEALACGIPVITTGYSAQVEFLVKNKKPLPGVEFIKYRIKKFDGSDSIYYRGFNWALPSVAHLRYLMRKVYNNYKKYKEGAMQSSEYIRKEWTWDKSADLIIERLKKLYNKGIFEKKRKKQAV